jgi:Ion channel
MSLQNKQSVFWALLAALLALVVIQPQVVNLPHGRLIVSALGSLLQVAAILVLAEDRRLRMLAWTFGLVTIVAIWSRHYFNEVSQETALLCSHSFTSAFLALTAVLILHFVMTHDVTAESVVAAICAYLLIGIFVGHLCFIVQTLDPLAYRTADGLSAQMSKPDARSALLMYYSFSTLTTTGYGDITPNQPLSRTLAWLEAATGQLYLAVLVAGLVSARASRRWSDEHRPGKIHPL